MKPFVERRPWATLIIALILGPVVAMLYLGRFRLALFYIILYFLSVVIFLFLSPTDVMSFLNPEDNNYPINAFEAVLFSGWLIGATHGVILASKNHRAIPGVWYARWYSVIVLALILPLILSINIRIFAIQPFNIPFASMNPTLVPSDYIFAKKFVYGINKYSIPFPIGLSEEKLFASHPNPGDVVIFKHPSDKKTDYIKRIIGLPGDKIQMIKGRLYINGKPVKMLTIGNYRGPEFLNQSENTLSLETLPNGVSYQILDTRTSRGDNTPVFNVPPGHYFVMGDNRDYSSDSRFDIGFVPENNIYAKVFVIWYNDKIGKTSWRYIDEVPQG